MSAHTMGNRCLDRKKKYESMVGLEISTGFLKVPVEKMNIVASFLYKMNNPEHGKKRAPGSNSNGDGSRTRGKVFGSFCSIWKL